MESNTEKMFGKQHRSCKHPIHIPLVEWHCGKRTWYSSFSSVGISFVSALIFLIISFRSLALSQRICMVLFHSCFYFVVYSSRSCISPSSEY
ncbi:hypothetical protein L210DRAFT_3562822, partial [Boletus edulis BED1]